MRTTSAVEANNMILNDNVINHGNLFTFIHDLRLEECLQFKRFEQCIESGGKTRNVRLKYKVYLEQFIIFYCTI